MKKTYINDTFIPIEATEEEIEQILKESDKREKAFYAREDFLDSELCIAKNCNYSLNDFETRLNNNVLVVGGSGTGKTRNIVTPNIYQAVGSYIISDPKGKLYKEYASYLRRKNYQIIHIDFTHPERGECYNPLEFLKSTQDILKISAVLVNEKISVGTRADPFWDAMSIIMISALIAYMLETDYKPFNFSGILKLIREGERDDCESKVSLLSERFDELKNQNPDSWACRQFDYANQAPYKTYDCIRATLAAKFAKLDTVELQQMMSDNDVDFTTIAKEKTAVFVTVSDTDRTMDVLANIFFTQAMQMLCDYADNECRDNLLPIPIRFILDDFATNCRIDEFPRMISTIRSRGISAMLMVQSEAQLKQGYADDDKTIISNCDTYVYLGGNDIETAYRISLRCNKNLKQVLYMPVGNCWVFRRGAQPVYTTLLDMDRCICEMTG